MDNDHDTTATDVFRFDINAARLTYLLNKRRRGEVVTHVPLVPADPTAPTNEELPALLRRQAQ
jgi:hypothetical protein